MAPRHLPARAGKQMNLAASVHHVADNLSVRIGWSEVVLVQVDLRVDEKEFFIKEVLDGLARGQLASARWDVQCVRGAVTNTCFSECVRITGSNGVIRCCVIRCVVCRCCGRCINARSDDIGDD